MKKIVNIKRDPVIVDTDTCDIKSASNTVQRNR